MEETWLVQLLVMLLWDKTVNSQFMAFHFLCKTELYEKKLYLLGDSRLFHCLYGFIYRLLFSSLNSGKNNVKPFLGLPSLSKIELASIATVPLAGQLLGTGNNGFNPLNGNLQAGFHINFHCCRIFVFIFPCFILSPQEP